MSEHGLARRGGVLVGAVATLVGVLAAQAPPGPPANLASLPHFLPLGRPAGAAASAPADLSGSWYRGAAPIQTVSMADTNGSQRGKEPDIPYQPWARQRLMAEVPPTGPFAEPHRTTDPWTRHCEPNGPIRIYAQPGRTEFVQLPDRVLMLHEVMQQFRIIRLNATHPPLDELDPTWWGDSIGWYENGDTLVIDTVGFNGRTWLSQAGHPTTERLHVIERYRRVNKATIEFRYTVDDPGAYTAPFSATRTLVQSNVPFMQSPWNCSVRDNMEFTQRLLSDAASQ